MESRFRSRSVWSVVVCLVVVTALSAMAMAQAGSTAIRGTVVDPQNSVIPNATVTIKNIGSQATRSQKSGAAGNFSFDLLTPGDYEVSAIAEGFARETRQIHALIDHPAEITFHLKVGAATTTVTVEGLNTAVQVNTQDSSLGNNFVTSQIQNLPIEHRDIIGLLTLQPGVTGSPNMSGFVSGARSDQSNMTLDGVNVNDAQTNSIYTAVNVPLNTPTGGAPGGPVLRLNSDAIEEFRVNTFTSNSAAARSSGAQIALVTKSGTNKFHGSAFEFNRNTAFVANDWFNNHSGLQRPALVRNTFGGSFGGPIIHDKLFFFVSYERRRDASQTPAPPVIVPRASLGQGIINFTNNLGQPVQLTTAQVAQIFPDAGIDNTAIQAIAAAAAKFPANSTAAGDGVNTGGFIHNAPLPIFQNSTIAKLDYNLANNHALSLRGNYIDDHQLNPGAIGVERFPGGRTPSQWSHPTGLAARHTWTIHNNFVSNFTYGYTREAYTNGGDTHSDVTYLRLIFQPTNITYDNSRVTPVHSFTEDLSLVKGRHTLQFGGVITLVNNGVINFNKSFSTATTNPSGYKTNLITNAVNQYLMENFGYKESSKFRSSVENAVTAFIGRYNNYSANFLYNLDGTLQTAGTPSVRHFATQGYEGYFQDSWKFRPNLTISAGLRYNLWRPVYETQGFEVQPTIPLGQVFANRVAAMNAGLDYTAPLTINKSGPVNHGPPMYNWYKTDFLPRVAVAWSPSGNGLISRLMGGAGKSVIRGGFAMLPDYFGESIATFFERYNTLGFSSSSQIPVNTFNVGCGHYVVVGNGLTSCTPKLGQQFASFSDNVKTLPLVRIPANLVFPLTKGPNPTRIESSLDSQLSVPKNYAVSLTYEREMPKNGKLQISYVGRFARNLLAQRDAATPVNLKDPVSGQTYYQAGTILEKARQAGVPLNRVGVSGGAVGPLPFFEHFFGGAQLATVQTNICPTCISATQAWYFDALGNTNDWTTTQLDFDNLSTLGANAFYWPQFGSLFSWDTIAYSNYHSLQATYQERLPDLTLDFNYTYSHSLDNASGLQAGSQGTGLIWNPFTPQDGYTASDFDLRHIITVASVWQLPFGKGKALGSNAGSALDALIGGWQLSGIFRFNTGEPLGTPFDAAQWSTNWEYQTYTTASPTAVPISGCSTRVVTTPKMFGNCLDTAYNGFRSSYPGDSGGRNYLRLPSYNTLDFGIGKQWKMPYSEQHQLQFRWEVFNSTNFQPFYNLNFTRSGWGIPGSVPRGSASPDFSNWTSIQGSPRVMQVGLRYSF